MARQSCHILHGHSVPHKSELSTVPDEPSDCFNILDWAQTWIFLLFLLSSDNVNCVEVICDFVVFHNRECVTQLALEAIKHPVTQAVEEDVKEKVSGSLSYCFCTITYLPSVYIAVFSSVLSVA